MFKDRTAAGYQLATRLEPYRGKALVLAIPRGGVPIGRVVADHLNLPLDLALCKKIPHPKQPEYAIGAATLEDYFIFDEPGLPPGYADQEVARIRERLRDMHERYLPGKPAPKIQGETVILVDDGAATGWTLLSMIRLLRQQSASRIVVAIPVAPADTQRKLSLEADQVVCLRLPKLFYGVGGFYQEFPQLSDEEVSQLLEPERSRRHRPSPGGVT